MSAVGCLINFDSEPVRPERLERMARALRRYGPDKQQFRAFGGLGLVQALYRTLPEDGIDASPRIGGDGRFASVFDGRIDNREDIGAKLGIDRDKLNTLSDGDLALRAFEAWRHDTPAELIGEFTLVVADLRERTVFAARDQLGKRPFFYTLLRDRFIGCSMPGGIFCFPDVVREINPEKVADYLVLNFHDAASTYFKNIWRLEPAHWMLVKDGRIHTHRYWDPRNIADVRFSGNDDYVAGFKEHLNAAVRAHLRSRGDVGMFLSGGLDSPTVAWSAANILRERGRKLFAYTSVPAPNLRTDPRPNSYGDEREFVSAIVSRLPNLDVEFVDSAEKTISGPLYSTLPDYCAPPRNLMNFFWLHAIMERARANGIRVMLNASMGNMTFSYDGVNSLWRMVRGGNLATVLAFLRRQPYGRFGILRPITKYMLLPALPSAWWLTYRRRWLGHDLQKWNHSAVSPTFVDETKAAHRAKALGFDPAFSPWADGLAMRIDILTRGAAVEGAELNAADRAAFGIDHRDPASDLRIVEYCLGIPDEQYILNGEPRSLVRRAMRGQLPDQVLDNRKMGRQAADWLDRFVMERESFADAIARFKQDPLMSRALDLDRVDRAVQKLQDTSSLSNKDLEEIELLIPRALAAGQFVAWVNGSNV